MARSDFEHWPRLTRFYGLAPSTLARMPRCLTAIYIDMLPVLQAEEQLSAIQAADHPHLEARDRDRVHRQLSRLAELEPPVEEVAPLKQGGIEALGALGIKVVMPDA